jgi:F-type H+-transporting ATPase subunit epsilon
MDLEIITSNGIALKQTVSEVVVPTLDGEIGVMKGHMPLVSITSEGVIAVRKVESDSDDQLDYYAVSKNGVIEIDANRVRILADEAQRADEIDEKEAAKAYEAAKKMVSNAKDKLSLDQAMNNLDRSTVRLKVAGLRRRHR